MTLQQRLKTCMRRCDMRVADMARHLDRPYTTVREWVLFGREPDDFDMRAVDRGLRKLER